MVILDSKHFKLPFSVWGALYNLYGGDSRNKISEFYWDPILVQKKATRETEDYCGELQRLDWKDSVGIRLGSIYDKYYRA